MPSDFEETRIRISALKFALELVQRYGGQVVYNGGRKPFGSPYSGSRALNQVATELHDEITTLRSMAIAAIAGGDIDGAGSRGTQDRNARAG